MCEPELRTKIWATIEKTVQIVPFEPLKLSFGAQQGFKQELTQDQIAILSENLFNTLKTTLEKNISTYTTPKQQAIVTEQPKTPEVKKDPEPTKPVQNAFKPANEIETKHEQPQYIDNSKFPITVTCQTCKSVVYRRPSIFQRGDPFYYRCPKCSIYLTLSGKEKPKKEVSGEYELSYSDSPYP